MRFLLDTNVISAMGPLQRDPNVLRHLGKHDGECVIAALVWHELRQGCALLDRGRRRTMINDFHLETVASTFPILPYGQQEAEWHASERARLQRAGRPAPFLDGQIAAIAACAGLTLVTANTKDFRHFKGLELADWTKR